jgi:hypothetical protein
LDEGNLGRLPDVRPPRHQIWSQVDTPMEKNEYATARCGPHANFAFLALELKQEEEYV